jgi:hypothetical protein
MNNTLAISKHIIKDWDTNADVTEPGIHPSTGWRLMLAEECIREGVWLHMECVPGVPPNFVRKQPGPPPRAPRTSPKPRVCNLVKASECDAVGGSTNSDCAQCRAACSVPDMTARKGLRKPAEWGSPTGALHQTTWACSGCDVYLCKRESCWNSFDHNRCRARTLVRLCSPVAGEATPTYTTVLGVTSPAPGEVYVLPTAAHTLPRAATGSRKVGKGRRLTM